MGKVTYLSAYYAGAWDDKHRTVDAKLPIANCDLMSLEQEPAYFNIRGRLPKRPQLKTAQFRRKNK